MDSVLLLNSGGSDEQLGLWIPSSHVPPKNLEQALQCKQIVKYSGFRSQIKGVLSLKLFSNIHMLKLESQY